MYYMATSDLSRNVRGLSWNCTVYCTMYSDVRGPPMLESEHVRHPVNSSVPLFRQYHVHTEVLWWALYRTLSTASVRKTLYARPTLASADSLNAPATTLFDEVFITLP